MSEKKRAESAEIEETALETAGTYLNTIANIVIKVFGIIIFFVLTWYALRYTQYMIPDGDELPINTHDSVILNLIFAFLAVIGIAILFHVEKRIPKKTRNLILRIVPIITMIWVGIWSFWWIFAVDRQPVGDQAYIYGAASYFLEGDYTFLYAGSYCGQHPYQLGLIAVVEFIFRIVGPFRYRILQFICACIAVGIVHFGTEIAWEISKKMTVVLAYCVLMLFCAPLVFYTGWVYGDLPSILFGMMLAFYLMRYEKTGQMRFLAGIVVCAVMAMLVRENSMILLIALCLTGAVQLIRKWDARLFLAIILSVLLPALAYQGIYKMYEVRSGIPHSSGFSPVSYIAMGMQEKYGKCGWYTIYAGMVYDEQGSNTALAAQTSKLDVMDRLAEFKSDPPYALYFYREKILSQWNEPLYQSLYFSNQYFEGKEPPSESFVSNISHKYFDRVLGICDRMQFIIYLGMFIFYLLAVKKNTNISEQLLAVTMIGGFLFSILWEAKARYILPYYIMMYPFAIKGYYLLISSAAELISRIRTAGTESEEEVTEEEVHVA